jgi:hypothetical protein
MGSGKEKPAPSSAFFVTLTASDRAFTKLVSFWSTQAQKRNTMLESPTVSIHPSAGGLVSVKSSD